MQSFNLNILRVRSDIDWLVKRRFPNGPSPTDYRKLLADEHERRERAERAKRASIPSLSSSNHTSHQAAPKLPSRMPPPSLAERQCNAKLQQDRAAAIAYGQELEAKSTEELGDIVAMEQKAEAEELRQYRLQAELALAFNQSSSDADFSHYSKLAKLTADQLTALSLGKDPSLVNWKSIEPHVATSAFARRYAKQREIILVAIRGGQIFEVGKLEDFLSWANRYGIDVDPRLVSQAVNDGHSLQHWSELTAQAQNLSDQHKGLLLEECQKTASLAKQLKAKEDEITALLAQIADAKKQPPSTTAEKRKLASLQKMVLGLAKKHHKYGTHDARKTVNGIVNALAGEGISIDDATVRTALREADEALRE